MAVAKPHVPRSGYHAITADRMVNASPFQDVAELPYHAITADRIVNASPSQDVAELPRREPKQIPQRVSSLVQTLDRQMYNIAIQTQYMYCTFVSDGVCYAHAVHANKGIYNA